MTLKGTASFANCNLGLILDILRFIYTSLRATGAYLAQHLFHQLLAMHTGAEIVVRITRLFQWRMI